MNPRIQELMSEALKQPDTDNDGLTVFDNDELEKFAELIVRECCDILDDEDTGDVYGKSVRLAMTRIKQHFGVEDSKGWVCPKCGVDRTRAVCPLGHTASLTGWCPMTAEAQ